MSLDLKVKYFSPLVMKLEYVDGKSDLIDLRSTVDVELATGDFMLIPLGIAMEIPIGYEAHIVPRSSMFKNYGILQTNGIGIIDESYSGDNDQWMMPVFATRPTKIYKGDRICQFRLFKHQPELEFTVVDHLDGPDRGGFGSTGKQ